MDNVWVIIHCLDYTVPQEELMDGTSAVGGVAAEVATFAAGGVAAEVAVGAAVSVTAS